MPEIRPDPHEPSGEELRRRLKMAEDRPAVERLAGQINQLLRGAQVNSDITRADTDLRRGHPLLRERWARLERLLREEHGMACRVIEVYRPEGRQRWLYGAGRTAQDLIQKGIDAAYARPSEPRVTNAWSAATSAHGWMEHGEPAAAALDVCPVGRDGRPYTADDPWDEFVRLIAALGPGIGLVHFHGKKGVWDRPHLELYPEWSNREHRLVLPTT